MRLRSVLLAAFCLLASAAWAGDAGPRAEDAGVQEVRAVAPGVWVLMEPRFQVQPIGNVTVIEQADGLVLVDSGGSPGSGRRIVAMVRALSRKPVKAVVITHWHGDHVQGLSEILKAWPHARTIATRATQAHLADPRTRNTPPEPDAASNAALLKQIAGFAAYSRTMGAQATTKAEQDGWAGAARLFERYGRDMDGALTRPVAEGFDRRLVLPDPHRPVEALFLGRANTDGDAVVWLPRDRIIVTGDIVVAPFPFGFGSYPADWLGTLAALRRHDFKVLVPGHGPPQSGRTYLATLETALRDIRRQSAAAAGLDAGDATARFDRALQLRLFGGDDPWRRQWIEQYWLGPVLASAHKEANGRAIVQSLKGD